ncbi:MAG: hypothetical protein U9O86_05000 [Campylobacterota bacterium]|nr:hypothetical protein [Campylobacterota bacterium]
MYLDLITGIYQHSEPFDEDCKDLVFKQSIDIASRSYMGGLNTSVFIGEHKGLLLDIDLSSCYPTILNMIRNLDFKSCGGIEEFRDELERYDGASLPIAMAEVTFTFPTSCKHPSLPTKTNDGLFYVYNGRTTATLPEIHLAIQQGAEIRFIDAIVMSVDNGTLKKMMGLEWTCNKRTLTLKDYQYHLNALCSNQEGFTFRRFLTDKILARTEAKKNGDELLQQLLKNYVNGLYGKTAQGINKKSTYVVGKGISEPLPASAITSPYIASMVTGTVRAALSCIMDAISKLDGYKLISATTDGVLYSLPPWREPKFETKASLQDYRGDVTKSFDDLFVALMDEKDVSPFADVDPLLYSKLLEYPTIRLIQSSRKVWGYDEFLEIKHICSEVLNIKTRGQVGHYEFNGRKYPTVLAKAGHKINGDKEAQAKQMRKWFYEENIAYNEVSSLASLRDIFDERKSVNDLVSVKSKVKVNTDYDYKCMPLSSGESDTRAFIDIHEAKKYRACAKNIRAEGVKSTAYNVQNAVKLSLSRVKKSGGARVFVIRHFLRALIQGALPINLDGVSYSDIAKKLTIFGVSVSKIKDAKRSTFVSNVVLDTPQNRSLIKKLLKEFGKEDRYKQVLDILLDKFVSY